MTNTLIIEIASLEQSLNKFKSAWKNAGSESYNGVGFENMGKLLSTLTPKRWELIEALKPMGSVSIYALAGALNRDYKNVYTDVSALRELGIIEDTENGISLPWDQIQVNLSLGKAA